MKNERTSVGKKTEELHLRITKSEKLRLAEKAKNYPSLSSYILDAAMQFDDKLGIKKIDLINDFAQVYNAHNIELNRVGVNLNQLAKYTNMKLKLGDYEDISILIQLQITLNECLTVLKSIKKAENKVFRQSIKL